MFPIVASHGEGRAILDPSRPPAPACLRYIDSDGHPTETYPNNPNGSAGGLTGFTSPDGRILLMMPHPERAFLSHQLSWRPPAWNAIETPWLRLFTNARRFIG